MKRVRVLGRRVSDFLVALVVLWFSSVTPSAGYTIDTAASPSVITGLWWNPNESGWGVTLTQQYDVIFVAMYTYDNAGNPIWYVITNCPVVANGCTGDMYKVNGGSAPTSIWSPSLVPTKVGTGTLAFTDNNTGTMNFSVNGIPGSKAITRQVFRLPPPAPLGLPPVIYSDVFQASLATAGGYRDRGVYPTKASSKIGCGFADPIPDRSILNQFVASGGGSVIVSTATEWCGQIGSELNCLKKFDNVVVTDQRMGTSIEIEIFLQGLLPNRMTTVSYSSTLRESEVSSRTLDSSVVGSGCSNSGQPSQAKEAINGDWTGYSVKYSPATKVASLTANSMACRNQTCTILGAGSTTFTLSSTVLWRTATGATQLAGGAVSSDLSLASMFVCNIATLDPERTFDDCTFFSFKRL